ncbi:site-specific integrase [Flavobacterium panacagri]|uniref:site-specific integrase n=1 Tax=Flavobacterium panacagri TaxID=3034146 RepID=UPI0025A4D4C1|nr:site-specific integrase [Flavobacterium panacagri]
MKKDYVRTDGTCALYVRIFLNKETKKIATNISVRPEDFDEKKQRIKSKCIYHKDYNLIIEKILGDLNKIEVNYRLAQVPLNLTALLNEFENPSSRIDFLKFWEQEMITQKEILNPSTYRQQMSILNKVRGYQATIYFYEITEEFFELMKAHFKKKKNTDSTIGSLIKSFKKYLHIANKKGITTPLDYQDIKNRSFVGDRSFLDASELKKMHDYFNAGYINATHKAILARFLFSCFTGLRISDILMITPENIIGDILVFSAVKTSKLQRIQLNKTAKIFIEPESQQVFPGNFTPEYINRELKFIAKICGITKKISFHVARHTFATNFLICGGRVEILQKLLGHSKITDTMVYVKIVESISNQQIHNMDDILLKNEPLK